MCLKGLGGSSPVYNLGNAGCLLAHRSALSRNGPCTPVSPVSSPVPHNSPGSKPWVLGSRWGAVPRPKQRWRAWLATREAPVSWGHQCNPPSFQTHRL